MFKTFLKLFILMSFTLTVTLQDNMNVYVQVVDSAPETRKAEGKIEKFLK